MPTIDAGDLIGTVSTATTCPVPSCSDGCVGGVPNSSTNPCPTWFINASLDYFDSNQRLNLGVNLVRTTTAYGPFPASPAKTWTVGDTLLKNFAYKVMGYFVVDPRSFLTLADSTGATIPATYSTASGTYAHRLTFTIPAGSYYFVANCAISNQPNSFWALRTSGFTGACSYPPP